MVFLLKFNNINLICPLVFQKYLTGFPEMKKRLGLTYTMLCIEKGHFFLVHCPIHRKKCFSTGINILSGISSDNCCIVSQPRKTLRTSKFYMIFPIISFIRPANKIRSWLALQKNNYMPYKLACFFESRNNI